MSLRGRLCGAIGFGYLGSVSLLAVLLVVVGCLLERAGRPSIRLGTRYDAAVVAVMAVLLRPIDRIPAAREPSGRAADSTAPADEPV